MPDTRPDPGALPAPAPVDKLRPLPLAWMRLRLKLDPDGPMLRDRPCPSSLLDRLEAAGEADAALCLAAHALPPREAVWWACKCARATADASGAFEGAPALERVAVDAAEAWVRQPDEAARARAYRAAQAGRFRSAEALAALAVFWVASQTLSMSAEAAAGQLGGSVERSVRLAALRGPMPARAERMASFLRSARDIAGGGAGHIAPADGAAAPPRAAGAQTARAAAAAHTERKAV